jgi:hypothetical protein
LILEDIKFGRKLTHLHTLSEGRFQNLLKSLLGKEKLSVWDMISPSVLSSKFLSQSNSWGKKTQGEIGRMKIT